MKKIKVEMPVNWLLTLAVYGSMGDGKIPKFMQSWARGIVKENDLMNEYNELQRQHLKILKQQLVNTLGKENVQTIEATIALVMNKLKK